MLASSHHRDRRERLSDPAYQAEQRAKKNALARRYYARRGYRPMPSRVRARIRRCVMECTPIIAENRRLAIDPDSAVGPDVPVLRIPKPPQRLTDAERALRRRLKNQRKNARRAGAGGRVKPADIEFLMRAQKGRCFYCTRKLGKKWHIDHFHPLSLGGSNERKNLRLACEPCNLAKSDKPAAEFLGVMLI